MKKLALMALAGFMMIAFTQCGGVSGSKEYKDLMDHLKKTEKTINSAKTCEELDKASDFFWMGGENREYAKEDEMTEEEQTKALEYLDKISKTYKDLLEKFGCD